MKHLALKITGSAYLVRLFWSDKTLLARLAVLNSTNVSTTQDELFIDCSVQDPYLFQWLVSCYADLIEGATIRVDFIAEYLAFDSQFLDRHSQVNFINLKDRLISVQETFRSILPKSKVA